MSIRKEKDGIHINQNTTPSHEEQGAFSYFRTFLSASQATLKNIKQDKNEPARFLGDGVSFKAKLIGILEVNEARGDRMCQEALADLKMAIRAAGEHKQRININIAIDGLRLRDEKTGDCLYHHPVHKISFIAQDMSDSRAFGYIFGSPDTGHRFFGIKTDKAASQVVITMRDLFQVVFELKKKEIEMAKQQIEQHQIKYSSSLFPETVNKISLEPMKTRPITDNLGKETACAMEREENQEHIMDLLDLELELSNIQQGIHQMDRITPSDPFGPPVNVKPAALDPFGDSFNPLQVKTKIPPPPESGKKTKIVEKHWFDQETEALFEETDSRNSQKPVVSASSISSSPLPPDAVIDESGLKKLESLLHREPFDVFTDLDPLGTGRSKPYIDKKDFFQDLKNPPKKVLKELACEPDGKHRNECDCETNSQLVSKSEQAKGSKSTLPNVFNDPFQEDPFDKDPFLEVDFSRNIFTPTSSNDPFEKFADFGSFESSKEEIVVEKCKSFESESTPKQTPLRVSLPPEKLGNVDSVPMSPLQSRKLNRLQKNYTISCVIKPPSPVPKRNRIITQISGEQSDRSSPIMEGVTIRSRNPNVYPISSQSYSDITAPEPPPRSTLNALTMKPPPLPPKRLAISAIAKPPPRPPQSDYDYIENYHTTNYADVNSPPLPAPARKVKPQKANSEPEYYLQPFPLLPPPKKKNLSPKSSSAEPQISPKNSVKNSLDITLSQLTKSGFSELAATLNMSPTSLSKMTLQDLTKCLTTLSNDFQNKEVLVKKNSSEQERTTNSECCSLRESVEEDSFPFTAEFDSHFSSVHEEKHEESLFDKYAVFRELLEEEKKQNLVSDEQEEPNGSQNLSPENDKVESHTTYDKPSEDRYAALREICLEDSVEKYDVDLSDKEDSVVEPSRLDEDIDLLPQSRQHSESTESPTVTMKEHPSIIEATIIEEDISALDADEEVLEESIHETLKDASKVYENRENETEVKHARAVFSPETQESKDQTTSWAKFDADSELPLESRSSAHSEGHVSPWSTESKDNDLSPACDKRKHRKVKRHKQAVWHEDEESEEGWDMRLERSWSPSWKENGWSDGDSVYDETPPYIGREYHSPRRGRRRRISPWNSREQSPWEEDDRDCEDQWEKTRWKEEPRQRPKHRGPSWEEDRRRHFDDPRKPRKLWSEMDRKSSGESLTWDEEDRYQKRSYAERRRRKWDEDVHNRNRRRERDYEQGKISNRYYRHDHWDHEYDRAEEENPRWVQRPRSCERGRRQFSLHQSTESDFGERRYIRSRDGHSVDMDYRRKAHTLQSQKQRRKHNQTSPFEDDFTSQFTFKDVSPGGSDAFEETKDSQFDTTPKLFSQAIHSSDFSREPKNSRSYQQSPFEDDFTPPEARRCSGRSASSELSDHREDVFFPNTNESRYKCESRRPKSAGQAESSLRKKNIKLFHTSESSSTRRDLPHPESDQLEKTLAQHITDRKQCTDLKIRGHLKRSDSNTSLRKSESVNIFARNNDPFDDDFFSEENLKINRNREKVSKNISGESKWNESFDAFTFEEK